MLGALAALTLASVAMIGPGLASASSGPNTALLNGDSITTVDGFTKGEEAISLEQFAAEQAGFSVKVVTGTEWKAMTATEFANYQVLIVGDPDCGATPRSVVESAGTWGSAVMATAGGNTSVGNRVVVGTDPEFHYPSHKGAEHLVQDGIAYAGGVSGATGAYFDTTCEDEAGTGSEITEVLEKLTSPGAGTWTTNPNPECGGAVQQIAEAEAFSTGPTKLEDTDIQGWSCSDHITFPAFPTEWHALAVATDNAEKPTCGIDPHTEELVCGQAYVLLAGRGIVAKSELVLTPESHEGPAGGEHTVIAKLTQKKTEPVSGTVVSFAITEQNAGVTGTCTTTAGASDPTCATDETGSVRFTYKDANGAGKDTINASATVERTIEEIAARTGARVVKTTESATATQVWTPLPAAPVVTPTPTPAPVSAVLAAKVVVPAKGTARAASVRGCVAQSSYLASVRGTSIASVTFTLDGHAIKTLRKPTSASTFATRVTVRAGSAHHLAMRVAFTSASKTPTATFRRTLARCAAVHHVTLPRFTG
jgi:hypothetical protein